MFSIMTAAFSILFFLLIITDLSFSTIITANLDNTFSLRHLSLYQNLENAYIIGQENFENWSQGFDKKGYLRVLPHPDLKVIFKDPFRDWQNNIPGNYISTWGLEKELEVSLKIEDLEHIKIDGFGILKAGDGKTTWLNNRENPYEFLRGFNGTVPGPLLITEPGDTLKIKLENQLEKSTQPTNLHVHGLHMSPVGHGDNVFVSVAPGKKRDINIKIPENHPIGTNWYHPHLHGVSNQQVSSGLAGQLWIGPPHDLRNIEKWNPKKEQIHFMALNTFGIQQIYREGKPDDPLNQHSSQPIPAGTPLKVLGETENGEKVYELSDAVNQGYNSKPLDYNPQKPIGNLQELPIYGGSTSVEPLENVIHTVNGQYNPTLELKTGAWNTFTFTNMSRDSFHVIQLIKREGNKLIPQEVTVVGMDNNSSALVTDKGIAVKELPLLTPAARVSIQHWFEQPGIYYLLSNGTEEILGDDTSLLIKGQKGFNNGFAIWGSQVLATIEVTGDVVPPVTAPKLYDTLTKPAKSVDQLTTIVENSTFNRKRTFNWAGNLQGAIKAGNPITLEGAWRVNGEYFATSFDKNMAPLTMPMLDTMELWTINNVSGKLDPGLPADAFFTEWHPFHIHQTDFTIVNINGIPSQKLKNQSFNSIERDTFPLPPTYAPNSPNLENPYGKPQTNGNISVTQMLIKFQDYPGSFVNHCHTLDHQDKGMMMPVRTILNTKNTWLGLGSKEHSYNKVELIQASNLQQHLSLMPYEKEFKGAIDVAIGDVNYKKDNQSQNVTDNVTDIITIQRSLNNRENKFTVKVFDGQSLLLEQEKGQTQFDGSNQKLLVTEFTPFKEVDVSPQTKASIATGDINGDGYSDIIVGIGEDRNSLVEIYSGKDFSLLSRIAPFHREIDFNGTINLASGDVNGDNYDDIIVAQGKGGRGLVELYSGQLIDEQGNQDGKETVHKTSLLSQLFQPYSNSYHGEVEVTSGYILQRPEVSNGKPVQTYHANITTLAVGDLPNGHEQIKVFTYLLDEHHGIGHESSSGYSLGDGVIHQHDIGHETQSNGSFDPRKLRLDTAFTPERKLKELSGTFADIPGLSRGEPVLYALDASAKLELIHLQPKNIPTLIQIPALQNRNMNYSDKLQPSMF